MKRYEVMDTEYGPRMVETVDGEWVRYDDIGKPNECICPDIDKCETAMGCLRLPGHKVIEEEA